MTDRDAALLDLLKEMKAIMDKCVDGTNQNMSALSDVTDLLKNLDARVATLEAKLGVDR